LLRPGVEATFILVGNASLTARPVRVTVLPAGLVITRLRTEVPFTAMLVGLNVLAIVGATSTGRVAVAVKPVPPLVELTVPVVLVLTPGVELVTLAVMVQLLPVLMVPPLRLKLLEPMVAPVKVAPEHVVAPAVDNVMPDGKVSLTATPASATVLAAGLVMVMVMVEVPFTGMLVEPKALVMVGGATTVKTALAVKPVPSFVELTVPVVLLLEPPVVAVTSTFTVQVLPGVAIDPLLTVRLVAPPAGANVAPQVLPIFGVAATCMPAGNASVTAIPFIAPVLVAGLVKVSVRVEVPPTAIGVGAKALAIVGGAVTVKIAEAVKPVPPFVELTVPVVLL
jgi:hypothetical protein